MSKAGEMLGRLEKSKGGRPEKNSPDVGQVSEYSKVLKETDTSRQDAGKALLMIEARIGELLPSPQQAIRGEGKGLGLGGGKGKAKVLPEGISGHQAQRARAIAAHPAEVAEVIREAMKNLLQLTP